MKIESRKLRCEHGTEGPKYDPYSFTTRIVEINGVEHELHLGLRTVYYVDGSCTSEIEETAIQMWIEATGLTVDQFDKAYNRVHPYFPDPMGHPSQYI